jgi:hypothetical protein
MYGEEPFQKIGETRPKPIRIKRPKQPAEGIVTGCAMLEAEKLAQQRLLRFGELRHIHATLAAA